MKPLAWVCAGLGLTLLAGAAASYWIESRPKVAVIAVPDATQHLGNRSVDAEQEATFTVVNPSDRPLRIVGGNSQCGGGICHKMKTDAIVTIPAHGEVHHVRVFGIAGPGPFDGTMLLYVEDVTGLRTIELRITGTGVAAPKPPQQ